MMPAHNPFVDTSPRTKAYTWLYFPVGFGAVVLGLLPWIVTGMRLPLQNLWAFETLPGDMPRVLLPFSQYQLPLILSMLIFGMGLAGMAVRAAPPARRRRAAVLSATGAIGASGLAAIQTGAVVRSGLRDVVQSRIYFFAVVAVIVIAVIVGLLALFLLALTRPPAASIGAALAALSMASWVGALVVTLGTRMDSQILHGLLTAARWLPALLVGAAMAWCGIGKTGQAAAWVVNLLLLWVVPAALGALAYAAGSRYLAGDMREMASAGIGVLLRSLGPAGGAPWMLMAALLVAVPGAIAPRSKRAGDSGQPARS